MKYLLTIVIISMLSSKEVSAQRSEVISDSAKVKAALFSQSLIWVTKTWKSANNVIELKDEQSGTIIVKGGLATVPKSLGIPADGITTTQLTIRVKDGKAKLEFENTSFKWKIGTVWTTEEKPSMGGGQYNKWKESVLKEMDGLISSFKKELTNKSEDF